jgi:ribonuclease P protein component
MHGPEAFSRARKEGLRRTGKLLVLWALRRAETPPRPSRLGLVVGRRHGLAVERNLFKRRLREAFRLNKERFPRGWDLVVTPNAPKGAKVRFPPSFKDLAGDLVGLVGMAARP